MMSTDIELRNKYDLASSQAAALWAEEMEGELPEFPIVTTPAAGGTVWTVNDEPVKDIEGVIIDDYVEHVVYLNEYTGESMPPDAVWIGGVLQYLSDEAVNAGLHASSYLDRGDTRIKNRQVLFVLQAGSIIPLKISLTGASCKPWKTFKQNAIIAKSHRVCDAVVSLTLESKKYASGFSGSVLVPRLVGFLDEDIAAAMLQQRSDVRQFTRSITRTDDTTTTGVSEVIEVDSPDDLITAVKSDTNDVPF